jgi:ATP-dependent DNA helicase RecG
MDLYELAEKIKNGEDSFTQFKETIKDSKKLAEEFVAFSNAEGGQLILGVKNNGSIQGLEDSEIESLNQLISNTAKDNIKPPIYPFTEILEIEGKKLIVISIKKGINKPYQTSSGFFYTKSGSDKRKISQEELRRLFAESNSIYADESILQKTNVSDLNTQLFYQFLERKDNKIFIELKSNVLQLKNVLQNLDLVIDDHLTLAGNLLFGINPQRFCKSFYIDCVYFDGIDISSERFITKEKVEGTLPEMFKQTTHFLKSTLRRTQESHDFNTIGKLEIPEESITEILINALVHRDYYINSSNKVFLFRDRLEIKSPGKLPNSLNIAKMISGISIHRNPILNSVSQYILPYSGLGSGIKRALHFHPELSFINDIEKEEFISSFKRPVN